MVSNQPPSFQDLKSNIPFTVQIVCVGVVLSETAPSVSVVVTSYNLRRLPDIRELLQSLAKQASSETEVIVVIEGSRIFAECVEQLCKELLKCRWLVHFEDRIRGISNARNVGVSVAQGVIIAFVDDDAILPPEWVQNLMGVFQRTSVAAVSGGARPLWKCSDAQWLPISFHWLIGATDWYHGEDGTILRSVWGMNMAFSREVFNAGAKFPLNIGGVGGARLHGEEQVVCEWIRRSVKKPIVYDSRLAVLHKVYSNRLLPVSICRNAFYMGFTRRILQSYIGDDHSLKLESELVKSMVIDGFIKSIADVFHSPRNWWRKLRLVILVLGSALAGFVVAVLRPNGL